MRDYEILIAIATTTAFESKWVRACGPCVDANVFDGIDHHAANGMAMKVFVFNSINKCWKHEQHFNRKKEPTHKSKRKESNWRNAATHRMRWYLGCLSMQRTIRQTFREDVHTSDFFDLCLVFFHSFFGSTFFSFCATIQWILPFIRKTNWLHDSPCRRNNVT